MASFSKKHLYVGNVIYELAKRCHSLDTFKHLLKKHHIKYKKRLFGRDRHVEIITGSFFDDIVGYSVTCVDGKLVINDIWRSGKK